jgi:hypothetical protein
MKTLTTNEQGPRERMAVLLLLTAALGEKSILSPGAAAAGLRMSGSFTRKAF